MEDFAIVVWSGMMRPIKPLVDRLRSGTQFWKTFCPQKRVMQPCDDSIQGETPLPHPVGRSGEEMRCGGPYLDMGVMSRNPTQALANSTCKCLGFNFIGGLS